MWSYCKYFSHSHQKNEQNNIEMTSATNHNVQRYPNGAARGSQQPFLRCHGRQPSRNGIIWLLFTKLLSFFLCHALRFFLAFYFSAVTIDNMNCGKIGYKRETHLWLHYITSINHVALVFNSSTNFIKYCLIGSRFRSVLIELFCSKLNARKLAKIEIEPRALGFQILHTWIL